MMFIKQTLVSAFCLATLAAALPAPDVPDGLVILQQSEMDNGVLTVYGDATPEKREAVEHLDRRQCGSNSIQCFSSNTANPGTCQQLINNVRNNGSGLPSSPRSICFSNSGGQCCISWANPVSGAIQAHLADAAQSTLNTCSTGSAVSGVSRNTIIGTTCTTQCLSNRASGCS
ncbi:hypothetical protein MFIFM68171_07961 [Madurella fahalii]|uniref:WD-like domain-containing protein n=1 Tax=Madurella fahalii TaxID=1157608 RepID=A0ABQ0GJ50_9PEZI